MVDKIPKAQRKKALKASKGVPVKLREAAERLSRTQALALIKFLLIFLQTTKGKARLSKKQQKSLAITESQLGVRLTAAAGRKKAGAKSKRKKPASAKQKRNQARAGRAMRMARREHITLKQAWAKIK